MNAPEHAAPGVPPRTGVAADPGAPDASAGPGRAEPAAQSSAVFRLPDPAALAEILDETRVVSEAYAAAGHRVYVVGGMVRDLHLGRHRSDDLDLDLTTDATPDRTRAIMGPIADAMWFQGERFGTIGLRIGERTWEITTHRAERYHADSRKPEVAFSTEIAEDLSRRDFTVNAMAISLPEGAVVDPFGGAADLAAGLLRTPLDPRLSFDDDPLRMLRAARFVAGYGLRPESRLVAAMTSMAPRLAIVSTERIRDELDKLLALDDPVAGLDLLGATGLLAVAVDWIDEVVAAGAHRILAALPPEPGLRLTTLGLGPDPTDDSVPFDRAQVAARIRALRHGRDRVDATAATAAAAIALLRGQVVDAPSFRRWWLTAGDHTDDARLVAEAVSADGGRRAAVSRALEHGLADELDDLGPPLDGRQVMQLLDLPAGPEVGDAVDALTAERLDRGPLTPDEARRFLLDWARTRST